ncbi:MAG: hypothetical protein WBP02_08310 [Gammaproteobacteria bacterium]
MGWFAGIQACLIEMWRIHALCLSHCDRLEHGHLPVETSCCLFIEQFLSPITHDKSEYLMENVG